MRALTRNSTSGKPAELKGQGNLALNCFIRTRLTGTGVERTQELTFSLTATIGLVVAGASVVIYLGVKFL